MGQGNYRMTCRVFRWLAALFAGRDPQGPGRSNAGGIRQQKEIQIRTNGRLLTSELGAPSEGQIRRAHRVQEVGELDGKRHRQTGQNNHVRQCKRTHRWRNEGDVRRTRHLRLRMASRNDSLASRQVPRGPCYGTPASRLASGLKR